MGQVLQFDPGGARHHDPDTSQLAAQSINATHLELLVHAWLFKNGGELTALEIASGMGMSIRTVSPRLAPLALKGGAVRAGKRLALNDVGNYTLQTTWLALP